MGSFDGAKICELVISFTLFKLNQMVGDSIGLYRDDGLAAVQAIPRQTENMKKQLCSTFLDLGLKITIEANMKIVNYLDVTFNLQAATYQPPYMEPDNLPQYVHKQTVKPST